MRHRKQVDILLSKAAQDEYILLKLVDDPNAPVELFGFHAQQAIEKYLKATLIVSELTYPRTHRLADLIDIARDNNIDIADEFEDMRYLTPFAVEYRYDIFPPEAEEPIDKQLILQRIITLRNWTKNFVAEKAQDRS